MADKKLREFYNRVATLDTAQESVGSLSTGYRIMQPPDVPVATQDPQIQFSGEHCGWAQLRDNAYISVSVSHPTLPAGLYTAVPTTIGMTLQKMELYSDALLKLPDSQSTVVVDEITKFQKLSANFKQRGLLHKRGILLWGPPGSGKSCTVQLILDLLVNQLGGIALQIESPGNAAAALQMIRRVEPTRQIVAIMEDMDALVQRYGESEYLALLDGETQVDNIVHIATTNYPERLDKRFVDRPSRFDSIVWIGMPSPDARRMYLTHKEPKWNKKELEYCIEKSKDYSIAHLRELIILTKCLGYSCEAAIERLGNMRFNPPSNETAPNKKKAGFAV